MNEQNTSSVFDWQASLTETFTGISKKIMEYAPQLLAAIGLLIMGWVVAHILRAATKKIITRLDSLFNRAAKGQSIQHETIKRSYAVILSKSVFWTVMLFFIAASANMLGWNMFSNWMDTVINYLPNLITGLIIILAGFLLSNGTRSTVASAASSAGIEQSDVLARVVQVVILFTTIIIGIEHIGIHVNFLTTTLVVIIGVLLIGGALAFSLGAKELVANIIGAQYTRKHCRIGETMRIGDMEGEVLEVTQTSIVLDTEDSRTVVPAKLFHEQISQFSSRKKEEGI
ncbi:MAG: mechanosensitive ion channel [SAR324 cluster bacterium]|nr:mechanosensitive ion channel [SAR324 cluster bacterium]